MTVRRLLSFGSFLCPGSHRTPTAEGIHRCTKVDEDLIVNHVKRKLLTPSINHSICMHVPDGFKNVAQLISSNLRKHQISTRQKQRTFKNRPSLQHNQFHPRHEMLSPQELTVLVSVNFRNALQKSWRDLSEASIVVASNSITRAISTPWLMSFSCCSYEVRRIKSRKVERLRKMFIRIFEQNTRHSITDVAREKQEV